MGDFSSPSSIKASTESRNYHSGITFLEGASLKDYDPRGVQRWKSRYDRAATPPKVHRR